MLLSCGKSQGTLEITTGAETDVFTKAPAPTHLVVESFDTSGNATRLGQGPITAGATIDLAEQRKDAVATIRVTARDDSDAILAQGSSLLIELGVLADRTLQIFVQRRGEMARMPGALGDARESPLLSVLAGRYIFVAGGTTGSQIYDLMSITLFGSAEMPFVPKSIAPLSTGEILITDDKATAYDFSASADSATKDVPVPTGGSFAEVAGGPTVQGDDGTQFVVGAGRTLGMPTDKILQIKPDGTTKFLKLTQARLGAAVCWVAGRGIVIAGGSIMGAGVETVPAADKDAIAVSAFGPIAQTGTCALLSGSKVAFGGSDGVASTLDLGCSQTCTPQPTGMTGDPIVQLVEVGGEVLALRQAMDGTSRAFRLVANQEVPFKIARKNARALKLPTGAVAIVGGSTVIESFAF
jgi:hypothetical protein